MNQRTENLLLLHLIVLIFGFTGVLGKLISLDAVPLVFWRCAIATVSLLAFLIMRKKMKTYSLKTTAQMAGIGLITAAHWITFFWAIKVSTISVALATLASTALFVSFFEPLVTKRKLDFREVVLGVVVIIGLIFIFQFETQYKLGILLALISAFLAGVFSTLNAVMIRKYDAINISFYELLAAAIGVFIYLLFQGEITTDFCQIGQMDWLWLILLGTVATAFAFVVNVEVMKVLTPFTVALTINLEPVYSILMALIIFGEEERMTPGFYVGALIILVALFADAIIKRRAKSKTEEL